MAASGSPPVETFPNFDWTDDPHPRFSEFREAAPVFRNQEGEYVVTRWADVWQVLQQPESFSSRNDLKVKEGWPSLLGDGAKSMSMILTDPPDHGPKRRLGSAPFTPKRLAEYESTIQGYVDNLIDSFVDRGEADLVAELANPLPPLVVCDLLLGISGADLADIERWVSSENIMIKYLPPEQQPAQAKLMTDLVDYVTTFVRDRLEAPSDDVISELARRQIEAEGSTNEAYLISECSTLFMAAMVTTTFAITMTLALLLEHPDQLQRVVADPSLSAAAFEEALRLEPPSFMTPRQCVRETEIGGVSIPAGESVLAVFATANRDPAKFDDPDRFDIDRRGVRAHIAFGTGPHTCLGAPLARLEGRIAIETLMRRVTDLRLVERGPRRRSLNHGGLQFLRAAFKPAGREVEER